MRFPIDGIAITLLNCDGRPALGRAMAASEIESAIGRRPRE